jgi:hypothetical protein
MHDIKHRQKELNLLYARFLGGGQDTSLTARVDTIGQQRKENSANQDRAELQRQVELAELAPEDLEIICQLQDGHYGELYRLLFMGDWQAVGRLRKQGPYGSQSQADQALLNRLSRITEGSPTRMYVIFKESGLFMRDKVKDNRTYLVRTIQAAIDGMDWRPTKTLMVERGRR